MSERTVQPNAVALRERNQPAPVACEVDLQVERCAIMLESTSSRQRIVAASLAALEALPCAAVALRVK